MSNLFRAISLSRLTTLNSIGSLAVWLGFSLAILSTENRMAIANPGLTNQSTPDSAAESGGINPANANLETTSARAKGQKSPAAACTVLCGQTDRFQFNVQPIVQPATQPATQQINPQANPQTNSQIRPQTNSQANPQTHQPSVTGGNPFVALPDLMTHIERLPVPKAPSPPSTASNSESITGSRSQQSRAQNSTEGGTASEPGEINESVLPSLPPAPTQPLTEPSTSPPLSEQPARPLGDRPFGQSEPQSEPEPSPPADLGPVTEPSLRLQATYFLEGDEDAVRARFVGVYPLSSQVQLGAVLDVTDDGVFNIFRGSGVDITELYVAAAPFDDLPGLRFVVGQVDLTSYFDRNSFAKDRATHFFNSVFQTNPALAAANISSRPSVLLNWTITDNVEIRAAGFSADADIGDFNLNSFATEVGFRVENFIIRGTYVNTEDAGSNTGFEEVFGIDRGSGRFGLREGDQEQAWGINAEYFIPAINMGIFGRYGYYENQDLDRSADTFMAGVNFLDVFMRNDRLGLGYGRLLSNSDLRGDVDIPDVWELFYDARVLENLRLGVMIQQRNAFSDTFAGFRIRTDFNLLDGGRHSSEQEP